MVKQRAGYKASLKEMKRVFIMKENPVLFSSMVSMVTLVNNFYKIRVF